LNGKESRRFTPPNTNLLYQEVTASIFQAILDGKLKPGERLVEETIAQELGLSRSPVRQALQEMERQGIVVIVPRKGAYVANWSIADIEDFVRVRILLEVQAVEQAATRITPQEIAALYAIVDGMVAAAVKQAVDREIDCDLAFHKQVVGASRNSTLIQVYSTIELRIHMFMIYEKYIDPAVQQRLELTQKHAPIVAALQARDAGLARHLIGENVREAAESLLERMRGHEHSAGDGREMLLPLRHLLREQNRKMINPQ
jgi:DNA-binding GntR family transcriptional regulator